MQQHPETDSADLAAPTAGAPYAGLTPDRLFDLIETLGVYCDGRLLALNSYENRVYQVGVEDANGERGFVVVKVYRPGRWSDAAIQEELDFLHELHAAEVPVVAPSLYAGRSLHCVDGFRFAVFPRQGGRPPEFDNLAQLERMGHLLGRLHNVGARSPFKARPRLDVESYGIRALQTVRNSGHVPPEMQAAYFSVAEQALELVQMRFAEAGPLRQIRLHADCHAGNVLVTPAGPLLVDFDDARSGPAVQDLWMLFSGDAERQQEQARAFFEGYRQFRSVDPQEWHVMEALRTLRLLHYSAWLAERWHDPAFPAAFPWFTLPRYWQDRILELREQVALMQEPSPLAGLF